jgi:hypothetical protein
MAEVLNNQEEEEEWEPIFTNDSKAKEDNKVEFELPDDGLGAEEEEKAELAKPVEYAVVDDEATNETPPEEPKELDGINTEGAQKRIRTLIRQRKDRDEELQKLRDEVNNLKQSVQERDTQLSTSLKTNIDTSEDQLNKTIEHAKAAFKQAVDSGDTDAMVNAQEVMSRSHADITTIQQQRQAWERYNNTVETTAEQEQKQPEKKYDPKAVDWAANNSWFGQDKALTTAALTIDALLKSEGYDPEDDDFYKEVDTRLRQQYPTRFQPQPLEPASSVPRLQDTTSSSAQAVAGASRTPKASSSKNRVKLTREDVKLAQKWGIPLDKYAAEKLKVDKADGEYTSIYNDI